MNPDSTVTSSSTTAVEGDVPPARLVEAAVSPVIVAPIVTFVSPSSDTSMTEDPLSTTTSSVIAPTAMFAPETGTPSPPAAPTVAPIEL
jgi:hypothetical protein